MPAVQRCSLILALAALGSSAGGAEKPRTGTLAGVVRFKGMPPARKVLHKRGDVKVRDLYCRKFKIVDEGLVVDRKSRGIANVFVYLERKPTGYKGAVPKTPAVLAIEDCRYSPHAQVFRTGQLLKVVSSDKSAFNAHAFPLRNPSYSKVIAPDGVDRLQFDLPERLPMKVNDDIHPWMLAWQLPLDHPFAAVTGKNGKFEIRGLPPGKYRFVVWHEKAGYLERALEVKIKANETTSVKRSYGATKFK